MSNAIKGQLIRNTRTGATGIVIGKWLNTWSNQIVYNVRVGKLTASWNSLSVEGAS